MMEFARKLIQWYEEQKRNLPWRGDTSPYSVWVSEVMLQQTTVPTVKGRFERWMERFPDLQTLAEASERDVLTEWEGLGYYQRATRLHEAARAIVKKHEGRIPSDEKSLLKLPGIGPYIASAIRSLAFDAHVAVVEANVCRVFMRLLAIDGRPGESAVRRQVEVVAHDILPDGDSSRFNQALMDFGSLVCRPRAPQCERCFAHSVCKAYELGVQNEIPRKRRKNIEEIHTAVAVFTSHSTVYLQQRPRGGLFGGMWEFPGGKVEEGESPSEAVVREVKEELGVACRVTEGITSFVHFYTRFKVNLHAFLCAAAQELPCDDKHRWVEWRDAGDYPMPLASRKLVRIMRHFYLDIGY